MNSYIVILPGFTVETESEMRFREYVDFILSELDKGKVTLEVGEGNTVVFYKSTNQHLPLNIMTSVQFNKLRAHQAFMNPGQRQQ